MLGKVELKWERTQLLSEKFFLGFSPHCIVSSRWSRVQVCSDSGSGWVFNLEHTWESTWSEVASSNAGWARTRARLRLAVTWSRCDVGAGPIPVPREVSVAPVYLTDPSFTFHSDFSQFLWINATSSPETAECRGCSPIVLKVQFWDE